MSRRMKGLLQYFRARQQLEKRMLLDVIVAVVLSTYLTSPLPNLIVAQTPLLVSLVLVGLLPVFTIIYLYKRLRYYISIFGRKKPQSENKAEQSSSKT